MDWGWRSLLEPWELDNQIIGGRNTIIQQFPILPSSLQNIIIAEGARYDSLPIILQQRVAYAFATDIFGGPSNPTSFPWAQLNNQKLILSFKPATEADRQLVETLIPDGEVTDVSQLPSSIPAYLVTVIPQLKLNGEVVKEGDPMQLGQNLDFVTSTMFAGRGLIQPPRVYKAIAGSIQSVNVIAGSVSPDKLLETGDRLADAQAVLLSGDSDQITNLLAEDLFSDFFYSGTLIYFAHQIALSEQAGLQQSAYFQLAAGTGTVGYEPDVDSFFGIPRSINRGGIAFDIPFVTVTAVNDGDLDRSRVFNLQAGMISSALEHIVPELMLSSDTSTDAQNPPNAISTAKAISIANAEGQRIYHVTRDNINEILPNINHERSVIDNIRDSVFAGSEVIIHSDPVSVPGWTGAGYVVYDPVDGDGAYLISGGFNGGIIALAIGIFLFGVLVLSAFGITLFSAPFLITLGILGAIANFVNVLGQLNCNASGALAILAALSVLGIIFGLIVRSIAAAAFALFFAGYVARSSVSSGMIAACNVVTR